MSPGDENNKMMRGKEVLLIVEWALLLIALVLITTTEIYTAYVSAGLVLLMASFFVRTVRTHRLLPRTGIEYPGLLFIISAGASAWIAYDRPTALLQFVRILAAATLYYAIADRPPSVVGFRLERLVASGLVLAAAFLAIYWPAKHDFSLEPVKFSLFTQAGQWINSHIPAPPGPSIHSNVAAGTLAIIIPFTICLVWEFLRLGKRSLSLFFAFLGLIILAGILITGSRGALLGLLGALGLAILAWIQRRWFTTPLRKGIFWSSTGLLALAMVITLSASGNLDRLIGSIPGPTGTLISRFSLWSNGSTLMRDYFFTGVGLAAFNLAYSFYSLLIQLQFLAHIHNFFLEVWIEQGIVGIIAFIGCGIVVMSWAYRALDTGLPSTRKSTSGGAGGPDNNGSTLSRSFTSSTTLGWAGLAGLAVVAFHGLVDVVFYIERTLPLLGMVTGFAYLATTLQPSAITNKARQPELQQKVISTLPHSSARKYSSAILAGILGIIVLLTAVLYHRSALGAWYANLGALRQAQIEIPTFLLSTWDKNPLYQVRQQVNLDPALLAYQQALSLDPGNLTALQRLTDIEMSRGQYQQALQHITNAWQDGHRDDVTRLLYGDTLVANSRPEQAAQVVRGIADAENRLMYQAWYRYTLNGDFLRAGDAWKAVLLLNPENSQARRGLADVQSKIKNQSNP